jgi:hypothetical protein
METLLSILSASDANAERESLEQKGGRVVKKKKGRASAEPAKKQETIFVYCHRRRMAASEDLLHLIMERFEYVEGAGVIRGEDVDPATFALGKGKKKPEITIHILKRRTPPPSPAP